MNSPTEITISINGLVSTAVLDNSQTSKDLIDNLPQTIKAVKWGEREYYGSIKGQISAADQHEHTCNDGDICYWSAVTPSLFSMTLQGINICPRP